MRPAVGAMRSLRVSGGSRCRTGCSSRRRRRPSDSPRRRLDRRALAAVGNDLRARDDLAQDHARRIHLEALLDLALRQAVAEEAARRCLLVERVAESTTSAPVCVCSKSSYSRSSCESCRAEAEVRSEEVGLGEVEEEAVVAAADSPRRSKPRSRARTGWLRERARDHEAVLRRDSRRRSESEPVGFSTTLTSRSSWFPKSVCGRLEAHVLEEAEPLRRAGRERSSARAE